MVGRGIRIQKKGALYTPTVCVSVGTTWTTIEALDVELVQLASWTWRGLAGWERGGRSEKANGDLIPV